MNYNFKIFALCLLTTSTTSCSSTDRPWQSLQSINSPKITIFDAGFIKKTKEGATVDTVVTFRNFPDVTLSCTRSTNTPNDILFLASDNYDDDLPMIVNGATEVYEIYFQDSRYLRDPKIVLESHDHPINPPSLKSTSCVFEWSEINMNHIFFVYQKAASVCVEYVCQNDSPNFTADNQY